MKKLFVFFENTLKPVFSFLWKHKKIVIMIICFFILAITVSRCFFKIKKKIEMYNEKKMKAKIEKIDDEWRKKNEEIDNYNYDDTSHELDELIRKRKQKDDK